MTEAAPPLIDAAREAAAAARLRYIGDDEPGYTRRRHGRGFTYRDWEGRVVRDRALRRRFEALVIPPAWTEVWICRHANGHVQATGRDQAGRKQYLYHARWRAVRDREKFDRMIEFGRVLPRIRRQVETDLEQDGLPRAKVLAAVVRLLETSLARVGNPEYAKRNESYGLTTLRKKHVERNGESELALEFSTKPRHGSASHRSAARARKALALQFEGKGGKPWRVEVADPRVVEVIEDCLETPGYELFKYLDDDGVRRDVTSDDVNQYLREAAAAEVTAKDFRTWAATVLAAAALAETEPAPTERENEKQLVAVVKEVAEQLGNTPAVCRQAYIHPEILAVASELELEPVRRRATGLGKEEAAVLAYLEAMRG
jgi:DNA topoisomerase-1